MDKKNNVIHLRIDDTLKAILEKHADQEQRTLTNYIYKVLYDAMLNDGELLKPQFNIDVERI